jgi:hypothetical protein
MKNGELYRVKAILDETIKSAKSGKLIYGVNKNLERSEREIKHLDAIRQPPKELEAFEQKRIKLCVDAAVKDEKGQPKTKSGPGGMEYDILDRVAFDKALDALREEYKKPIDDYKLAIDQFTKTVEQENDSFKLYKIKYSVFEKEQAELPPEARLNAEQVRAIWFMLDDDIDTETNPEKQTPELTMVK